MTLDEQIREALGQVDEPSDDLTWAILREEWSARRRSQ